MYFSQNWDGADIIRPAIARVGMMRARIRITGGG